MSGPRVGIAGLTHLGLNTAAAFAERGCRVVGHDGDVALCEQLAKGVLPISEPGLDELLQKNRDAISFSPDPSAVADCSIVYVAQDVPTDSDGKSDLAPLCSLVAEVSPAVDDSASLVLLSQVPPGFTRRVAFEPARLFYQVETLVFGRAVERALHPERFIVGSSDPDSELPAALLDLLRKFDCPILQMNYESAEFAKIAINCCLAGQVGVTNTLAELCERIGADWADIASALRLDRRIGPHAYLEPGLGISGGNLERDLATVCDYGNTLGTETAVIRSLVDNSHYRRDWAFRILHDHVLTRSDSPRIGILGLAYKPGTASTKNSPTLRLIEQLAGFDIKVHDELVGSVEPGHTNLVTCPDPADVWRDSDALVVMTPSPSYVAHDPAQIAQAMRGDVFIDPFGLFDRQACLSAGLNYFRLGKGNSEGEAHGLPC